MRILREPLLYFFALGAFVYVAAPPEQLEHLIVRGAPPAATYLSLGVGHILTRIDHLLFVFGLLLLVGWRLLKTFTCFTIAHSATLAATVFGWIHIRSSVVEALIALSIVVLAVELVRRQQGGAGLTSRYPWVIASVFGLLHGCAFAGALAEVGLPQEHLPLALLLFNMGVEIGQLLFIAGAAVALWVVGRWINSRPAWSRLAMAYAIGGFSSYWLIERFLIAIGMSA